MAVVYRDRYGVEYESVPLPTHEVTHAVPLDARIIARRTERKTVPYYAGTDGAELATQPRGHRKQWSDAQWGAFEEFRRVDADRTKSEPAVASAIIVKSS